MYAGKDPLSGRELRFRKTRRTGVEAQGAEGQGKDLQLIESDGLAEDLLDCCLPGGLCPGHGRLASGGQREQGGAREIRDDIHEAFLSLASAIICWRRLRNLSLC